MYLCDMNNGYEQSSEVVALIMLLLVHKYAFKKFKICAINLLQKKNI